MTDKMTVILDKRNLTVTLDGKALRIDRPGARLQRIPLGMVGQVIAYGSPSVGCNVWRALGERGIPAVLMPGRGGGTPAFMGPGLSTSIMIRIAQFQAWSVTETRQEIVAYLVQKKISGQLGLLKSLFAQDQDAEPGTTWGHAPASLGKETERVLLQSLGRATAQCPVDTLRGQEGAAAKAWFAFLTGSLDKGWGFSGRNRRPPRDPVNALLSLSYTLLMGEVKRRVQLRGLDPCLGFLHAPYPGRESLVLDLMEPLRPGVDAFVLGLLDGMMTPEDFSVAPKEGCRISKEGRGRYYMAWEEWKTAWPVWSGPNLEPEIKSLDHAIRTLIEEWTGFLGVLEEETEPQGEDAN
ncbi:MAG: CRISPR-associated endonuclease Cas1 [Desulfobacteraceae bacterium]|nr:CRISPR-associated endonuclease Cas1 [Desulfobacteraceae bacterium]